MVESWKVLNKHKKAPQNAYKSLYKAKKTIKNIIRIDKKHYPDRIKYYLTH